MKTSKNLMSLLAIAIAAIVFSNLLQANVYAVGSVLLVAGVAMYVTKVKTNASFFEGLTPDVWIPLVKEDFYPDNSFLSAATDMSDLVDFDTIKFAEAGADPTVMKNNTTYPVTGTGQQTHLYPLR